MISYCFSSSDSLPPDDVVPSVAAAADMTFDPQDMSVSDVTF